jgi:hypothetical protein
MLKLNIIAKHMKKKKQQNAIEKTETKSKFATPRLASKSASHSLKVPIKNRNWMDQGLQGIKKRKKAREPNL